MLELFDKKALEIDNLKQFKYDRQKSGASCCFLEQETLHTLLKSGWFQKQIPECFYKLTAFYTIKLT